MVKTKLNFNLLLASLIVLFLMGALIVSPDVYMQSVSSGILVWATAVLPALFPFFFFTKILSELQVVDVLSVKLEGLMRRLFNLPGITSYVFVMSILSGYPVGAKLVSELYEKQLLSKGAVYRTLAFASTSGPLFVIGSVGVGMYVNKTAGVIILLAHILSALLNGLLYRKFKLDKNENVKKPAPAPIDYGKILGDSIYNSIISVLIVGGYIALFFMVIDVLTNFQLLSLFSGAIAAVLKLFGAEPALSQGIASGFIEITRGCLDLAKSGASIQQIIICACAIISWGGFSIHLQALTFLKKCRINTGFYFLQKLTHSIIAVAIAALAVFIIPL